jgi:hypothetical protein
MPEVRALIGCDVEIVVRAVGEPVPKRNWDSLKGSVLRYDDPFEPIDVEDWEALQWSSSIPTSGYGGPTRTPS